MSLVRSARLLSSSQAATQLIGLARRAQASVPFYHRTLVGIDLDTATVQDLPILTKAAARMAQDDLLQLGTAERSDLVVEYTSGSTGIPLRLVRTRMEVMRGARALWKARAAHFADVMQATGVQVSASALIAPEAASDKTIVLSAFDLRPDRVGQYLDQLDQLQPAWLRGHPAILALLAEGVRRTNRRLRQRLVFIESNSGWLSPETRDLLAETFECRVANHYGTRETYTIAYECLAGRMHLLDSCVVAEIQPHPQIVASELIVSSLLFEMMPFIRYNVGDLVEAEEIGCSCGRATQTIRIEGGRSAELIAGTSLLGTYVFHVVVTRLAQAGLHHVLQYQVAQTERDLFEVQFVLDEPGYLPIIADAFRAEAAAIVPDSRFVFRAVDHIEPTSGGKVQAFIRRI